MFKHNASVAPSSLDNIVNVGLNNSTQAIFSEISIFDELKIFQHPFVKNTPWEISVTLFVPFTVSSFLEVCLRHFVSGRSHSCDHALTMSMSSSTSISTVKKIAWVAQGLLWVVLWMWRKSWVLVLTAVQYHPPYQLGLSCNFQSVHWTSCWGSCLPMYYHSPWFPLFSSVIKWVRNPIEVLFSKLRFVDLRVAVYFTPSRKSERFVRQDFPIMNLWYAMEIAS